MQQYVAYEIAHTEQACMYESNVQNNLLVRAKPKLPRLRYVKYVHYSHTI